MCENCKVIIINNFSELDVTQLSEDELNFAHSAANNIGLDVMQEMRRRQVEKTAKKSKEEVADDEF